MTGKKTGILERDSFYIALLGFIVIAFCGRLLFTDQIIRASDVITQFFWSAKALKEQPLLEYFRNLPGVFRASWDTLSDGGRTLEGGWNAIDLLFYRHLILHLFPFPASIAWLAVLSLLWGGIGTYFYCRIIGISRFSAFVAGLLFALCTENASLINAGHIQKIEAISWLPWVLLFLEKALQSGRVFHYAMTALMLSVQFFTMHWQISFYTCLTVGAYCSVHAGGKFLAQKRNYAKQFRKDLFLSAVLFLLFFTTIAMSFAPLFSWSKQSERGGGMSQEEGMSWSMPPEELLTFVVPGLLGYSRQEGGDVPAHGEVYYWGRMHFTQTNDYLGFLPWFLIPLPLIFRRDRAAWFFSLLMAATLVMALGKYTFIYQFIFRHIPGFSTFRVPKMILFLFAFGAAVLSAKGIDILKEGTAERRKLVWWLAWLSALVTLLGLFWLFLTVGGETVINFVAQLISAPTRYQSGGGLIMERYGNMLRETGIGFAVGGLFLAAFYAWFKKWLPGKVLLPLLVILLLGDLWRVDSRFFVLTAPPQAGNKTSKNDIVQFLEPRIDHYRMQPFNQENTNYYSDNGIANISAYVTISEKRYKEYLDSFSLMSTMPDIMNLKYIIIPAADFAAQKGALTAKYVPVFESAKGSVVLENRTVLPKAWLVPSALVVTDPRQELAIMNSEPAFNPAKIALVESQPPFSLAPYGRALNPGSARVDIYSPNRIVVTASANMNAMLVLGEKYYRWWYAKVDGKEEEIYPVDHILRGLYLVPGTHKVEFVFDPLPFKIGKWLTLLSFAFFTCLLGREWRLRRMKPEGNESDVATRVDMEQEKEKEAGQEREKKKIRAEGKKKKKS